MYEAFSLMSLSVENRMDVEANRDEGYDCIHTKAMVDSPEIVVVRDTEGTQSSVIGLKVAK
jgi:hypothetical protein